jgi:hypothetical protein
MVPAGTVRSASMSVYSRSRNIPLSSLRHGVVHNPAKLDIGDGKIEVHCEHFVNEDALVRRDGTRVDESIHCKEVHEKISRWVSR